MSPLKSLKVVLSVSMVSEMPSSEIKPRQTKSAASAVEKSLGGVTVFAALKT